MYNSTAKENKMLTDHAQLGSLCLIKYSTLSSCTFMMYADPLITCKLLGKGIIRAQQTAALHTYTVTLAKSKDGFYLVVCHTSLYLDDVLIKF